MYKVIETARLLGVSKVTIYKKIKSLELDSKAYTYKKGNVLYLKDEAVEKIRQSLIQSGAIFSSANNEEEKIYELEKTLTQEKIKINYLEKQCLESKNKYRSHLKKKKSFLQAQISMKKRQLASRTEMLEKLKAYELFK